MTPNEMVKEFPHINLRSASNTSGKGLMSTSAGAMMPLARLTIALAALLLTCPCVPTLASAEGTATQRIFPSPDAAASALVTAGKVDDMKALSVILGPDADQVLSSGDTVADDNARNDFVRRYQEMHRLAYDDQDRVILYIGADNWPFPIPLVKKDGGWAFDSAAGKEELLCRRVGRNELFTIKVLENLADAQAEYASEARDGKSTKQFAQRILSDTGKRNGLYWESTEGQPDSPIGPLIASASAEGYKLTNNKKPLPFHGYYYKVLTRQGKNAPGGSKNYIVNAKMTTGFAFLAYPAEYRASGVMTFMINHQGIIVQKDLGPDTAKLVSKVTEFNPDKTWEEVFE
jgi:hypothetical protein